MKARNIILCSLAILLAIVSSLALKSTTNFGQGTLFSKNNPPCHRIECNRDNCQNKCPSPPPYYTLSSCTGTEYPCAKPVGL